MSVFKLITHDSLQTGFIDVQYIQRCFNIENIKPISLWSKICSLGKDRECWYDIMILIELCLCTPFSNATLKRFFSDLEVVKMELRSRLLSESLNSLMRIRMKGLSITDFDKDYSSQCVSHWYGSKARRIFKKSKRSTKHGKQRRSNDQILKLITWTVILPMFLRVTKNDFIVSRFLKAINKLKYNSSVFSFYSSVCVLLLSFTVRKIFTFYFFVLTDFAICCFFFCIHI